MKIKFFFVLSFCFAFLLFSCKDKNAQFKNKKQITQRIQYDVFIKSPNPEFEWWRENIEGEKREQFIRTVMNAAVSGKLRVFDYFNKKLSVDEVKNILNRIDTVRMQNPKPPYNDTTVIIQNKLDLNQIVKFRFLEEWYMDEKTLEFAKKVIGIAPIYAKFEDDGVTLRGFQPLFWVYLDENYPPKDSIK